MRKILSLALLAAFSAAAFADINVGVSVSATGAAASLGIPEKNTIALLPASIGGQKVNYIVLDDATDPTLATRNIKKLISENKVDVVIGSSTTPNSLAMIDEAADNETPMISMAGSAIVVEPMDAKRHWVFKSAQNDAHMATAIVQHMTDKKVQTVAFIGFADAYGDGWFKEFAKIAELRQLKVVASERYQRSDTSVTGQILKIMAAKPEYVFANIFGTDIVTVSKQGDAIGFFKQINNQFAVLYDSNTLAVLGDQAILGTVGYTRAPFNYIIKASPEGKAYVEAFKARYGSYPGDETTSAYDCVMNWAQAVEAAKTTAGDAVIKQIETLEFNSPRGKFHYAAYDHMGNFPVFLGHVVPSKEYGQPVLDIEVVVPGDKARPSEADVMKSRAAN